MLMLVEGGDESVWTISRRFVQLALGRSGSGNILYIKMQQYRTLEYFSLFFFPFLRLSFCSPLLLSLLLSVCPSQHPSLYLSVSLFLSFALFFMSFYPTLHLFFSSSVPLSTFLFICPSIQMFFYPTALLSNRSSIQLFFYPTVHLGGNHRQEPYYDPG